MRRSARMIIRDNDCLYQQKGRTMFDHTTDGVKIALAALLLVLTVLGSTLGTVLVHGIGT